MFAHLLGLSVALAEGRPAPTPYDPGEVVRARATRTLRVGESGAIALRQEVASGNLSFLAADQTGTVPIRCAVYEQDMWDRYLSFFEQVEKSVAAFPNAAFAPADPDFKQRLERSASPGGVTGMHWCDISGLTYRGTVYVEISEVEACFVGKGCLQNYAFLRLSSQDLEDLVGALGTYLRKGLLPTSEDVSRAKELLPRLRALSGVWSTPSEGDTAAVAYFIARGHGAQDSLQRARKCLGESPSSSLARCFEE